MEKVSKEISKRAYLELASFLFRQYRKKEGTKNI